ncbi:MMPL family transporter [Leucobacter sp. CSA2]|uniref:MMPL family transporter n=1 Tax=Leucobacter edaphi TaxID=2796472 RepID=A0A934UWN8_9MICO|nr:MMPL family transporter [Leucobacter edaphi]MBK0421879.1 MMPL family transporter [Leucobacter edaphi]
MSTLLYALGRWATRAKYLVLALWIAILALLGAGAAVFGQGANAPISIPGTESQDAITSLSHTFPEVSGTHATIIVVAAKGHSVEDQPYRSIIEDAEHRLADAKDVTAVQTPFSEQASGGLSKDGAAALITLTVDAEVGQVDPKTEEAIIQGTADIRDRLPTGAEVSYGGDLFSAAIPGISPTEAIGVVIAFVVLILTLGSLIAAGMPLIIAILGVGVSIAGLFFVTAFAELTSTTPMLALMLGLAVGIDYTLFIVSRHQEQLRAGVPVEESIARATATSGSAVVFAGLTVIIALVGLSVAGIPFLTALGVAAAAAVAVAVLIAVTLTPAIMAMAGLRILPKRQRKSLIAAANGDEKARPHGPSRADRFFAGWVRTATRRPIITILVVLVGLGIATVPAAQIRLALPNATSLPADDPAKITYDLTGEHFGEGANGPLLLTGSIIGSTDPLGLMEDLADEVRKVPGVASVPLATPNQGADTGIIQVEPEEGPHAQSTAELVQALRDKHDEWEKKYDVSLAVTGFTAVGIDVSQMLLQALVPFGILVVGLSLVLLAMVFRSVWVPIKATLGYLLSVGAAFGAVIAVFQLGWGAALFNVHEPGPVLSFMPIILMGVLFGLAMDYEVFLVSRIREEYVHGADAQQAIQRGFVGSAKVVTAAALIMFAVFAAFVPEGDPSIKVIAFGLAVGVFVDAFIVRMTLVPAVLSLLGNRAWWMPRWLAKILPSFDVEGEGLARELAHANWPEDMPDAAIAADRLLLPGNLRVDALRVPGGAVLLLDPRDPVSLPLAEAVTGRGAIVAGTMTVDGLLLPERAGSLRGRAAWTDVESLRETLQDQPALVLLDLRDAAHAPVTGERLDALRSGIAAANVEAQHRGAAPLTFVVLGERGAVEPFLPAGTELVQPAREAQGGREAAAAEPHGPAPALAGAHAAPGPDGPTTSNNPINPEGGAR